MSSSVTVGKFFARIHLFLIPEETTGCDMIYLRDHLEKNLSQWLRLFGSYDSQHEWNRNTVLNFSAP
jgi:membrane glycosyltransferase